jgi:hypothetical protein
MNLIIELLQWALLVFLGVMVFGLTRQLGSFIVPRRDQLVQQGPELNSRPLGMFGDQLSAELRERLSGASDRQALVMVVDEGCVGCMALIDRLEAGVWNLADRPLVAVVKESRPEFVARVGAVADWIVDDPTGRRMHDAGITATPYGLILDRDLRVRDRDVGGGVEDLITRFAETAPAVDKPAEVSLKIIASPTKEVRSA